MKLTSLVLQRLALVAVAAFSLTSAKATQVPAYNPGDLLLGFYDYSGSNVYDYLVDLGPITNFNFANPFVILSSTSHMGADLQTVFNTTWYTSGNIYFGLAVSYPLTAQVYVSNPNDGTPWTESPAQGTPAASIGGAGNAYSLSTQGSTILDPRGLEQADSSNNSWYSDASTGFGNFNGAGGDNTISDVITNSIEFDRVNVGPDGTPGTDLGSFSIDSSGDLSFIPFVSIPEPSTFAILGIGALTLAAAKRRRRS